jgi:protein-S-isoprenylcysteine O-methyltransferase Ste14
MLGFHVLFRQTTEWQLVFWASFVGWFLIEMGIASRDRRAATGRQRDRGSKLVIYASVWLGLVIAFWAPYLTPWARIALPAPPVFWTAIGLIWSGVVLRLWAVFTLGKYFRFTVHIHEDHRLVTSGPYRVLRHPAYSGGLLTIAGIGLAMGNWISPAGAFLCLFFAYGWRIVVEEAALRAEFGEAFEAHRKRTWAVIPLLW